jgi:hypothetical protein
VPQGSEGVAYNRRTLTRNENFTHVPHFFDLA